VLPDIWKRFLTEQRLQRDGLKLTRKLRSLRHLGSTKVQIGSHEFLNFSSNDYLGLTGDLRIAEAAASAAGRYGWGTAASRLVTGSSTLHTKLEGEIAAFRGTEAGLVFGSGYQANLGVLSALAGANDTIISDEMNHASIVAGCKLSGATIKIFKHRDYDDLERKLNSPNKGKVLVVTDSVFSIEGDTADLPRCVKLCERFKALLVVDDAHANACLGKRGRGVPELQNALASVPIVIANFSKALGSYGGFVACDEEVRDFLVNQSRPFIYTTAIPIALAAANLESLKIVRREGDALRQRLAINTGLARGRLESAGFELTGDYHVIGIRMDTPEAALKICNDVEFHGLLVHPMRWPTVPEGRDCVRISITAAHTEEDIGRLVDALKRARAGLSKHKTGGLTRRQNKRPTHQQLVANEAPASDDFGDFGDFDDHPGGEMMTAVDSSRLPPPEQVAELAEPEPAAAGDTMIVNPSFEGNERPTAPIDKLASEMPTVQVKPPESEEEAAPANEDAGAQADQVESSPDTTSASTTDDDIDEELPVDDVADEAEAASENAGEEEITEAEPELQGSAGETLAPEAAELADPVIADIEGSGTRRRRRKTAHRRKNG
jgi:8-amino-7-oxononanoate synthase